MNRWGEKLHASIYSVTEMTALGFGIEKAAFTKGLNYANHLLAPTGSDLEKYWLGSIFAGFHYDISFLTIHGKSRFPGLFIWLKND